MGVHSKAGSRAIALVMLVGSLRKNGTHVTCESDGPGGGLSADEEIGAPPALPAERFQLPAGYLT